VEANRESLAPSYLRAEYDVNNPIDVWMGTDLASYQIAARFVCSILHAVAHGGRNQIGCRSAPS
jgi:hypothetical protein